MMASRTLLTILLVAAPAAAQPADPPPLAPRVWAYLEATGRKEARALERELRGRKDLTAEAVRKVLDAGPPREAPRPGVSEGLPFEIPGTGKRTTYTLGVPEGLEAGRRYPLWISVHGTGGTERWAFRDVWRHLRPRQALVVAPTEARDLHGQGWGYRHRERTLHMGLLDALARELPLDLGRVYVCGLSRGGHAAFDLGMRYSDRIAGVMPVIGAVQQRDRALLVNLHDVRLHSMNGTRDQPALVEGARKAWERLQELRYPATALFDPERGHGSFADHYPEVIPKLLAHARPPAPATIRFAVRDLTYGRHYWVRITGLHKTAYRPGKPVRIPGVGKMSEAERRSAYLEYVEKHTPWVKATWTGNRLEVSTKRVTRFEVFVPAALVDASRTIEVVVNGRTRIRKRRLRPSPMKTLTLLREFCGDAPDAAFRFVEKLPLTVR